MFEEALPVDPKLLALGERETRKLPVRLTDAEVQERLRGVARLQGDIDVADRDLDAAKEAAKSTVKGAELKLQALRVRAGEQARIARTGEEDRDVEVMIVVDRSKRRRLIVRTDTGATVDNVPASRDEITRGCEWIKDLEKGITRLTHEPTGVVVEERVLTAEERQLTIDAVAERELVWISGGTFAQLTADELEYLECPVPRGTRLTWEQSGVWQFTAAPKGPTLDGLYHQLAVHNLPFKSGNDAPRTIGDLARRKTDEAASATGGGSKVRSIKSKAGAPSKTEG